MDMTQPDAAKDPVPPARSLGAILVEAGRLNPVQARDILQLQQRNGLRFGEAARQLGILDDADILFALSRQFDYSHLASGDATVSPEVMAAYGSRHPLVEGLRDLRSRLILHWLSKQASGRSLTLVSARSGEGKSFIAANLAVLFSQLGQSTLLVDADLVRPTQHRLFKLDNRFGLSTVLSGMAGLEVAAPIPHLGSLVVLPAGPTPPNPRELLSRPRLASLLTQAGRTFDVVLVDTPSVARGADAQMIAAYTGASLLVSRPNAASVGEVAGLTANLGNLLGAVVNQF